jgi:DNA repair exonuclease SbcCD ATPase subunit
VSKRPNRSRHRPGPPPWVAPAPVEVDEDYERQVEESTRRLQQQYHEAQRRARRAEQRLSEAQAKRQRPSKAILTRLETELQLRREELAEYERMMQSTAASSVHRGVRSFQPVPHTQRTGP